MFLRSYVAVTAWWDGLKVRAQEERGATAVEYALMVALIAVVIIVAVQALGNSASESFQTTDDAISGS
jgi:pilus assembly protein Flp/PilA